MVDTDTVVVGVGVTEGEAEPVVVCVIVLDKEADTVGVRDDVKRRRHCLTDGHRAGGRG